MNTTLTHEPAVLFVLCGENFGLATAFDEMWRFEQDDDQTHVARSFEMHPKSALTGPLLWQISFLLKRAIARHLEQMAQAR